MKMTVLIGLCKSQADQIKKVAYIQNSLGVNASNNKHKAVHIVIVDLKDIHSRIPSHLHRYIKWIVITSQMLKGTHVVVIKNLDSKQ